MHFFLVVVGDIKNLLVDVCRTEQGLGKLFAGGAIHDLLKQKTTSDKNAKFNAYEVSSYCFLPCFLTVATQPGLVMFSSSCVIYFAHEEGLLASLCPHKVL